MYGPSISREGVPRAPAVVAMTLGLPAARATARRPLHVAFVFPWDLASDKATAIRARVTIDALRRRLAEESLGAVSVVSPDLEQSGPTRGFWLQRFVPAALRDLEAHAPDVIHAMTTQSIAPALLYRRRHPETRVVFEMHGLTCLELDGLRLGRRLMLGLFDAWGAHGADAIVAMSFSQRELLRRWLRVRREKVQVLWGPVDLQLFRYDEPPPAPPFVIGYAVNDVFWQGTETIIAAARLLRDQRDMRVHLLGFPAERYRDGLPDNVSLLGVVPRDEVPSALARCHVLVSPRARLVVSDSQYPFKLSAYLAAGRPIVATAVSDQPRVIAEAGCGVIVPPGDPPALAAAIRRLAALPTAERLALGRRARAFAEQRLSLDALADVLGALYGRLCRA
jgi:glycosyltransferase involved in cell wall biosynthesis